MAAMDATGHEREERDIHADIASRLGGQKVFGRPVESAMDLAQALRDGLPVEVLDRMTRDWRFTADELRAVIPPRTLRHRRARNERLHADEADRAIRIMRVLALAERTFADADKADRWLRRPLAAFAGDTPLALATSETGARVVESYLDKIAWGAAA
jgi:putative toxin-antitoxin system antitoxin component (TIGR02293 family)